MCVANDEITAIEQRMEGLRLVEKYAHIQAVKAGL
jgi:hypothetical protein